MNSAATSPGNRLLRSNRLAWCVGLALHGWAFAQQTPAAPGEAEAAPASVKITGQAARRETEATGSYTVDAASTATPLDLSPRETPQSISIITKQRMEDQNMRSLTDVVANTNGLAVHQYETSRAQFVSRGFDVNTVMIDGTPTTWEQPWSSGEIFTSLALFDRVEIVRGATGLVSGAGDPGAAINMVRKRAWSREFTATGELEVGSWNAYRAYADVQTPLNDAKTVRLRVLGEYWDRDSYVDLLSNTTKTIFGTLEADLTPNMLLTLGASRQVNDAKSSMWGGLPVWYADGGLTDWPVSKTTSADWVSWDTTYDNYFARLDYRFDNNWKVSGYFTQGNREADSYLLYTYGAPDRNTGLGLFLWPASYLVKTEQRDFSLTASGPFELAGRKHEAAFGYVNSRQDISQDSRPVVGGIAPGDPAPDFNTWTGNIPQPSWGSPAFYGSGVTKQEAVYAVARFSLMDPLKLIIGGRLTNYDRTGNDIFSSPFTLNHDHEFTPYAGVTYDFAEDYTAYASYTTIFQPQNARDIRGNLLPAITGKASEVGVKAEYFGGRLNTSAALFQIVQDNLAEATGQFIPGTNPPEMAYVAGKGATSKGFELEVSGELMPGWNISAGYSQFKLTNADGQDVNTIYPRKLLKLFTAYRFRGEASGLTIGGGVNWESDTYTIAVNPLGVPDRIEQGAFALVNLMARYQFTPQLSAQLNVGNVFDKKYFRMFDAYSQITYGEPRSATLSMRYTF